MKKSSIVLTASFSVFSFVVTGNNSSVRNNIRPNVIIILSDDQGWGDLSINGNKNLSTPNIDRLAESGVRFTRFFVSPVCSPTRAELLTGRYHPRNGVFSTSEGGERMDPDETTIARIFKSAGYRTAIFGKWHNGMQYPYHPNARGFDEFYGFCSGHWGDYFSPPLEHNGRIVNGKGYLIDDLTDKAIAFMVKYRNHPFLLYVPYNSPHSPMQVPDRWWNKFKDKQPEMSATNPALEKTGFTRAALAMCENIDWNVGRILIRLKELKLEENTIVLYFSDNGPNSNRWNDGMKGIKGSTDEGGIRSPLCISWKGRIPAGRKVDKIAAAIDLLPTLTDLAGIDYSFPKPPDGISLKSLLTGNSESRDDRVIFSHWNGRISARTQQFRYDYQGNLYDMMVDPGQEKNVAPEHPDQVRYFAGRVAAWKKEVLDGAFDNNRPFTVGHPDFRYTQLPARDGVAHGEIRRSNKFPNSSYFTNWKTTGDKITWDAEVLSEGDYKAEIYYTCPAGEEGSEIRLTFLGNFVTFKVGKPHNPPLRGMENDRVERTESYVKDFKPLNAGTLHLTKGRGKLTLQATHIPGNSVMDFRLLLLTRINR